eukprot:m.112998 g.112998  ORF g.112998 m.112998 type:complete len:369 (-) comp12998_c0_seq2:1210-2316(-)
MDEVRRVIRLGPLRADQFEAEVLGRDEPVVITEMLGDWGATHWSAATFAEGHGATSAAVGRAAFRSRHASGPAWETDCAYRDVTLGAFARWATGASGTLDGWEKELALESHWGYLSYARLPELFAKHPEMLEASAIDWRSVGMEESFGEDTNFWFGTEGSVTHLHYDTYGTNVVAQLWGVKKWTLFPPSASQCLYPTRTPFEESSVFSEVNINCPDTSRHPLYSAAKEQVQVATLGPGDLLFVPRHWWHEVEALTPSISVNRWIPEQQHDADARVTEGLARLITAELKSWVPDIGGPAHWLNPSEEEMPRDTTLQLINAARAERGPDYCATALTTQNLLAALTSPPVLTAWKNELDARLSRTAARDDE